MRNRLRYRNNPSHGSPKVDQPEELERFIVTTVPTLTPHERLYLRAIACEGIGTALAPTTESPVPKHLAELGFLDPPTSHRTPIGVDFHMPDPIAVHLRIFFNKQPLLNDDERTMYRDAVNYARNSWK